LIEENTRLKAQLGITKGTPSENRIVESTTEKSTLHDEPNDSINLLSYGSAQESIMRIENPNIANELIKSIETP